jgi:hypothetical protein
MAESNFGIMELLQKLIKDRGTGVSDKEFGIMSGKQEGKGFNHLLIKIDLEMLKDQATHLEKCKPLIL